MSGKKAPGAIYACERCGYYTSRCPKTATHSCGGVWDILIQKPRTNVFIKQKPTGETDNDTKS